MKPHAGSDDRIRARPVRKATGKIEEVSVFRTRIRCDRSRNRGPLSRARSTPSRIDLEQLRLHKPQLVALSREAAGVVRIDNTFGTGDVKAQLGAVGI